MSHEDQTSTAVVEAADTVAEDPTSPFQYGTDAHTLILYTHKNKGPFTIQAYIEKKGIVKITNVGTMNNELKIVVGPNKMLLPDDKQIFVTSEIKALLNLQDRAVSKRRDLAEIKKFDPDATGVHIVKIHDDIAEAAKKIVGM